MPQVRATLTNEGKRASPEPRSEPPTTMLLVRQGSRSSPRRSSVCPGRDGRVVREDPVERSGGEREQNHHGETESHAELQRAEQLGVGLVEAPGPT